MADIFEDKQETPVVESKTPATVPDDLVNKMLAIVDDTGRPKYTTLDAALDALKHSQEFIPTLQRENAEYKKQAEEAEALKAQIEQFKRTNTVSEENPQAKTQPQGGLNEEAVAELVRKVLSNEGAKVTQDKNIASVSDALSKKYGDKTDEVITARAAELGLTKADLKEMSATKPQAVLALFGSATPTSPNPTLSTTRPPTVQQENDVPRPEKSLISGPGATGKARADYMRQIRDNVYKRLDVTT